MYAIRSYYELQVVAAIRGVTTGGYLAQMGEYEMMEIKPELLPIRRKLIVMTEEYDHIVQRILKTKDNELIDFHARRLVEMAGNIIMGYLLMLDTNRDERFRRSTEVFVSQGKSENHQRFEFIENFSIDELSRNNFV